MTQTEVLKYVEQHAPVAISDVPASRQTVYKVRDAKLLKSAGTRRTGQRGRPASLVELSAKGRKRLERLS